MTRRTSGASPTSRSRVGSAVAAVALAVGVLVVGPLAAPAFAACSTPSATPTTSPHAFEGTVVALSNGGLNAVVVRKDGTTVEVKGGTGKLGAAGPDDRMFVVGALYRFEPTNDTSPYADNACTATKAIWSPTAPGPTDDPDPEQSWLGFSGFDLAAVGVLALGLGGSIGARVGFRRGMKVTDDDRPRPGERPDVEDDDSDLEDFPR